MMIVHRKVSRRFSSSLASALDSLGLSRTAVNSGVFDGRKWENSKSGEVSEALNPATGEIIAKVGWGNKEDFDRCVSAAFDARATWARTPSPVRGDFLRKLADAFRNKKKDLGLLLSAEMGKILVEGEGEVQEFIDICDMASGLSRIIPGGTVFPSERAKHAIIETWNPLGVVGIIAAFNFPNAVFGWNSAISLMCGNTQITKGAETASLVTIATQKIIAETMDACGIDPRVATLCQGKGKEGPGEFMTLDPRIALVSFTGSTNVGQLVSKNVNARFGRCILELGGNNASVVMPDADMNLALRSVLFSAVGTCGQRCTSLRRVLLHEEIYGEFLRNLVKAYQKVQIGDPLDSQTLLGPLHSKKSVEIYKKTLDEIKAQGGKILYGGDVIRMKDERLKNGNFVLPTIVEIDSKAPIVSVERFVPILYALKVKDFQHAVEVNNSVKQGLTSSIFTRDMRTVFEFIGPDGSDTGICNVNTSCSGAEIGGAFGGNKETGGGRESGSDAWKQYMRRGTCTINFSNDLPLAQGIAF